MSSSSQSPRRSPEAEERQRPNKIFVTNLEIDIPLNKLQTELNDKFSKYGKLESLVVKKSFNNEYSFAFIQYKEGEDATIALKELSNTSLFGKKMKVELQDNSRRRKGGSQTCFVCGKPGHYARNCRLNKDKDQHYRKSVSSQQRHKKKSKKSKRRSSSSQSRSPKKKDKKKHSKKIKKSKHKKERKHSDSDSSR